MSAVIGLGLSMVGMTLSLGAIILALLRVQPAALIMAIIGMALAVGGLVIVMVSRG